jgi:hypothetical protein
LIDKYYNPKKDNEDDDLSGCLASGFLGKHPNNISKTTARQKPVNDNSGDLSGCLASGFLGKHPNNISKTTARQKPVNDNSGDLSGCLASGFLGKHPKDMAKVPPPPPPPPPRKSFIPPSDEDLSGYLASGFLGKSSPDNQSQSKLAAASKDDDLSGCLASGSLKRHPSNPSRSNTGDLSGSLPGGFRTSQIAPRRSKPAPIAAETEPDDSPASDWFYTN